MGNQEILNKAVAALNCNLYQEKAKLEYDGDIPLLIVMGKRFVCMIEPTLTLAKMTEKIPEAYKHPDKNVRYLYVTINANPKVLEEAKLPGINVLDCAGNFNIKYQLKNGNTVLLLANKGEKPIEEPTSRFYPIFMEKGLRVIFHLLREKKNITLSYRDIADASGVALGTVKNIIDGMISQRFVHSEGKRRLLTNTDRLLMLWTANYGQTLKPKLLEGRFTFRDTEKRHSWKEFTLPEGMVWGGEPAAALTDGFLTPGEFTIYTGIPAANLMKTGMVVPDINGEIAVYEKFWIGDEATRITPPILTYADLMDSANGRCIEAAQNFKNHELKYLL